MKELVTLVAIALLLSSCNLNQNEIYRLGPKEKVVQNKSKVQYYNGLINYSLVVKDGNKTKVIVNGKTLNFTNTDIIDVVFLYKTNTFLISIVSNNKNYLLFKDKLLEFSSDVSNIFLLDKGILHLNTPPQENPTNLLDFVKKEGNYLMIDNNRFGPYEEIDLPSTCSDKRNWWLSAKTSEGKLDFFINGKKVLKNIDEVNIPSFYGTNWVVSIISNGFGYIVVNGKTIKKEFDEVFSPLVFKDKWFSVGKYKGIFELIRGNFYSENAKVLISSSNEVQYPSFTGQISWIKINDGNYFYLIKNYKEHFGPYDEVYYPYYKKGFWAFIYRKDKKWFLKSYKNTLGPFESIEEVEINENGKIFFSFKSNNSSYMMIDNKILGPYEEIIYSLIHGSLPTVVFRKSEQQYISIGNNVLGPFDEVFWNTISFSTNGKWIFSYRKGADHFINYSGKDFGPFNGIYMPTISKNGEIWGAGVLSKDNTFSLLYSGKILGNYIDVDYESIKFNEDEGTWGGVTKKNNGTFLTTSYKELGPFDDIVQLTFSDNLSRCNFTSIKNNKWELYSITKGKVKKLLDNCDYIYFQEDSKKEIAFIVFKRDTNFFINYRGKVFGPFNQIKELSLENGDFYFVASSKSNEVLNHNGRYIFSSKNIIRVKIHPKKDILHFDGKNFYLSDGKLSKKVLLPKETIMSGKIFFTHSKYNEWVYLFVEGNKYGPFNSININSFKYFPKFENFVVYVKKSGKFFVLTESKTFGPFDNICNALFIAQDRLIYLAKKGNLFTAYLNEKKILDNVLSFSVDYNYKNITFMVVRDNKVFLKTMKAVDLLNQ